MAQGPVEIFPSRLLIVGTLSVSSKTRYGMTTRHVPYYLFTPYDRNLPPMRVSLSTTSQDNLLVVVESDTSEGVRAAGSVALPRGLVVQVLGSSGDREAESKALKWEAVPFPNWPDPEKPAGAWIASELQEGRERVASVLASRPHLDWPCTFSIDSEGTQCIDDCISVRAGTSEGEWEFFYAVTDATPMIREGGQLEARAREFGETLITGAGGGQYFPLLPPSLAFSECRLLPGELRPALVFFFTLKHIPGEALESGDCVTWKPQLTPVVIKNQRSFTYSTAIQAIDEAGWGREGAALRTAISLLRKDIGLVESYNMLGYVENQDSPHSWIQTLSLVYNSVAGKIISGVGDGRGLLLLQTPSSSSRLRDLAAHPELLRAHPDLCWLKYEESRLAPPPAAAADLVGCSSCIAPATSPLRRWGDLENQRLLLSTYVGEAVPPPPKCTYKSEYYVALARWLNSRRQAMRRHGRDTFFLMALNDSCGSLITVTALFLRLRGKEEEEEEEEGGGGEVGERGGQEKHETERDGAIMTEGEFWVPSWKRLICLKLRVIREEVWGGRFLRADESGDYSLNYGEEVSLNAFADLRSKNWKRSMVFSIKK